MDGPQSRFTMVEVRQFLIVTMALIPIYHYNIPFLLLNNIRNTGQFLYICCEKLKLHPGRYAA